MSICSTLDRPKAGQGVLSTGLSIGLAGGLAEIVVVWLYSALAGGDAAVVARHVASAVGLDGASAVAGVGVHVGLAMVLGIALSAGLQILGGRRARKGAISCFMVGSLAVVWVINYFIVLPAISPNFVHLLPYAVTLASKLAFGFTAAATLQMLPSFKELSPTQILIDNHKPTFEFRSGDYKCAHPLGRARRVGCRFRQILGQQEKARNRGTLSS